MRITKNWQYLIFLAFLLLSTGCVTLVKEEPITTVETKEMVTPQTLPDTVPELVEILNNGGSESRLGAARRLGKMKTGVDEAIPALTRNLYYQGPYEVREAAAWALGEIGSSARPSSFMLSVVLLSDFISVRKAAAEALGKIGCKEAVPALAIALRDPDHYFSTIVAEAFEKLVERDFSPDKTAYYLDENGIPIIVNNAIAWWEQEGQHMDWKVGQNCCGSIPK